MAANMWKYSSKNVESGNNKILYETLLELFSRRNGIHCLNKPRTLFSFFLLCIHFRNMCFALLSSKHKGRFIFLSRSSMNTRNF